MLSYRARYPKDNSLRPYVTAKLIQLLIWVLLLLKFVFGLPCNSLLVMLLVLAAATGEAFALLQLLGVHNIPIRKLYYGLSGVSGAGVLMLNRLYASSLPAVILTTASITLMIVYPVYLLCIKLKETPLQKVTGLLYIIVILSLLGQLAKLLFAQRIADTALSDWLQGFFYIGIYLLMFLGTAGYMLLSRERTYAELERGATYDELTGILNRRAFVLRARPMIDAAVKEGLPLSFLLMDVDHFKQVNDTYGHDTGDKVLKDLSRKIEEQLANGDLFGRFGGEEFAVLLHRADEAASDEIAERLRRSVLGAVIEGVTLPYTVSIGVITLRSEERVNLNTLYKLTDTALYQAKQQGRNCIARSYEFKQC